MARGDRFQHLHFLFTVVLIIVHIGQDAMALTFKEESLFTISGSYEASVYIDSTTYAKKYVISASGMPDHPWQRVNLYRPKPQHYELHILKTPEVQPISGCLPMGMIGITRTGVAIYNPLTKEKNNAVEGPHAEVFDNCDGHPTVKGVYHYHKLPDSCLYSDKEDELIGVALDGFPIYGPYASWKDSDVTSADLDACHGYNVSGEYRYYVTADWPYYLGCFRGKVIHPTTHTTYNCRTTSSFDSDWGYLCSCPDPPSSAKGKEQANYGHLLIPLLLASILTTTNCL